MSELGRGRDGGVGGGVNCASDARSLFTTTTVKIKRSLVGGGGGGRGGELAKARNKVEAGEIMPKCYFVFIPLKENNMFDCLFVYHLFIYIFINLFIHSFIYLFIHSFIHLFIHSFIHSFIYLFIHSFIHSFIYLFIYTRLSIRLEFSLFISQTDHASAGRLHQRAKLIN